MAGMYGYATTFDHFARAVQTDGTSTSTMFPSSSLRTRPDPFFFFLRNAGLPQRRPPRRSQARHLGAQVVRPGGRDVGLVDGRSPNLRALRVGPVHGLFFCMFAFLSTLSVRRCKGWREKSHDMSESVSNPPDSRRARSTLLPQPPQKAFSVPLPLLLAQESVRRPVATLPKEILDEVDDLRDLKEKLRQLQR